MVKHFKDFQEADEFANEITLCEVEGPTCVMVEGQEGTVYERMLEAVQTIEYQERVFDC